MTSHRQIRRSKLASGKEVQDLLQLLFVAELLQPSVCLWIVSPWVSDIPILDNNAGAFDALNPDWGPREVHLSEVLVRLAGEGTTVCVATRDNDHSRGFLTRLHQQFKQAALTELLICHPSADLHEKGLVGDDFWLSGSMNLTYRGIQVNDELVTLATDQALVEKARLDFHESWPGRLHRDAGP